MSHGKRVFVLAVVAGALALAGFAAAAGITVTLTGSGPDPAVVTASLGDTVTFTNSYVVPYAVSSPGLGFTSPQIPPGSTFEYVATKAGNFAFFQLGPPRNVRGSLRVLRAGSVTLEAPPGGVRFGDAITLTGTTSLPAFPVVVRHMPVGANEWQDLMTVTPAADGSFAALVQPEKATVYRAGTLENQLVSPPVRVPVRPRLTLRTSTRETKVGRRVAITIRVVPPGAARAVALMGYNRKWRAWRLIVMRPLVDTGVARFLWRAEPGRKLLRAQVFWGNLTPGYAESASSPVTVRGIAEKKPRRAR